MGHKRLGYLPKTKVWRLIVSEIAEFALAGKEVSSIALHTLMQVQKRFSDFENDPAVRSSFEFLIQVAHAFQKDDPVKYLTDNNILDSDQLTLFRIAKAASKYKDEEYKSNESKTIAKQAVIDAINHWFADNTEQGRSLFNDDVDPKLIFSKAANAGGFCEISRLFFSNFTERYLKYFLEREASAVIPNLQQRKKFNSEIEKHVNDISKHAFETAEITQSFAAGWFNKHVKEKLPDDKEIKGFLSHSFGKMKSELLMEAVK